MQRTLPQFWSNNSTECTDDSDSKIRVQNHSDQLHEELSISSLISSCPQSTSSTRSSDRLCLGHTIHPDPADWHPTKLASLTREENHRY